MARPNVHEHDPEVGAAEVEGQELADFSSGRQLTYVRREALDRRRLVPVGVEAPLDGLAESPFHLVTVKKRRYQLLSMTKFDMVFVIDQMSLLSSCLRLPVVIADSLPLLSTSSHS